MDQVVESFWRVRTTTDDDAGDGRAPGARRPARIVEAIDAAITAASTNWRFERIAAVDRNILRIGAYELMHEPQTPSAVVIDEAVEMARRFGEADSPAFVNGVLDAIMRKRARRGGEEWPREPEGQTPPVAGLAGGVGAAAREGRGAAGAGGQSRTRTATSARHTLAEVVGDATGTRALEELETLGGRSPHRRPRDPQAGRAARPRSRRSPTAKRACRSTCGKDEVGEQGYRLFDLVDLGDFIGVAGRVMRTRKGELSVQAQGADASCRRRCCRRPRSGTASRTWRSATASATST